MGLRGLALTGLSQITSHCFQQLAYGCPRLKWLSLADCRRVGDAAVQRLTAGCTALQTWDLFGLAALTNAAVDLTLRCHSLTEVSFSTASNITRDKILGVRARHRRVRIYFEALPPFIEMPWPHSEAFFMPEGMS